MFGFKMVLEAQYKKTQDRLILDVKNNTLFQLNIDVPQKCIIIND